MTNENLSSSLPLWNIARNDWWEGKDNLEIAQPQLLMFTGGGGGKTTHSKRWEREKRVVCGIISVNFMRLMKLEAW